MRSRGLTVASIQIVEARGSLPEKRGPASEDSMPISTHLHLPDRYHPDGFPQMGIPEMVYGLLLPISRGISILLGGKAGRKSAILGKGGY